MIPELREKIFNVVIELLRLSERFFESIPRTARGSIPATGFALDISPWHGILNLSLRMQNDFPIGELRYDITDWEFFDFSSNVACQGRKNLELEIAGYYENYNGDKREAAHMIYWAGAEAILSPNVAELLQKYGISAPVVSLFKNGAFEFIVCDADQTFVGNYCEFVLASRLNSSIVPNKSAS